MISSILASSTTKQSFAFKQHIIKQLSLMNIIILSQLYIYIYIYFELPNLTILTYNPLECGLGRVVDFMYLLFSTINVKDLTPVHLRLFE